MKKIFLYVIVFSLVLTSIFVLQHTPISSYEEPEYKVSLTLTEEAADQMTDIEIPIAEKTAEQPVKEDTDIKSSEKTEKLPVKKNTDVATISTSGEAPEQMIEESQNIETPIAKETEEQPVKEDTDIKPSEETENLPAEKNTDGETLSTSEETQNNPVNAPQEPLPVKEEVVVAEETEEVEQGTYCTIEIICDQVLENMEKLPDGKKQIIPTDGVILAQTKAEFFENESVFNVTSRELKARKIHIDFVYTPMYNSVYIKGINNLYEKDCTAGSGWVYTVNGQTTDCGASAYKLKNGDQITWTYIIR